MNPQEDRTGEFHRYRSVFYDFHVTFSIRPGEMSKSSLNALEYVPWRWGDLKLLGNPWGNGSRSWTTGEAHVPR